MNTLRGRLTISYTAISLVIVASLSLLFNLFADGFFEQYAISQQKKQITEIINQVNQQYVPATGLYDVDGLGAIASAALLNGMMIHVRTPDSAIDWDVRTHKATECQVILKHLEENMHSQYPNFQGGYRENTYDLKTGETLNGYLTIGYYGPYALGDNELKLLQLLNRTLVLLGVVFSGVAILLGLIMAKRIAAPIISAMATSKKIAEGSFGSIATAAPTTREMADLIDSINEMSRALATKDQQKRQLTADVAHELRTPLNNLQGHVEAMIDQVLEPTTERLENCHAEILRLARIVDRLQELDILENGRTQLEMSRFDFKELCVSLFTDFEVSAREKGVALRWKGPSEAIVYGDINRIKQCMMNLLSNAIEHTPGGGTVTAECETHEELSILRLRDSGTGIPPEDLKHIFERFYRVDKSRCRMSGGMGIGLSITKAIVEAHGGSISVESQVGAGSVFTIRLPFQAR